MMLPRAIARWAIRVFIYLAAVARTHAWHGRADLTGTGLTLWLRYQR